MNVSTQAFEEGGDCSRWLGLAAGRDGGMLSWVAEVCGGAAAALGRAVLWWSRACVCMASAAARAVVAAAVAATEQGQWHPPRHRRPNEHKRTNGINLDPADTLSCVLRAWLSTHIYHTYVDTT